MKRSIFTLIGPLVLVLLGVTLTLLGFFNSKQRNFQDAHDIFLMDVGESTHAIEKELHLFSSQLELVASLFTIFPEVSRKEFSEFTQAILSEQRGIQAIEWSPKVNAKERSIYENRAHSEGYLQFHFKEENQGILQEVSLRPTYYPVYYIEPFKNNEAAFGFDLGSNPIRLTSIKKAAESQKPTLTQRIRLIQEKENVYGVLLIVPVFLKPSNELVGIVIGVMRIGDIIETALHGFKRTLHLTVMDKKANEVLYSFGEEFKPGENFTAERTLLVGDREWVIIYQRPIPLNREPYFILIFGTLLSCVLGYLLSLLMEKVKQDHIKNLLENEVVRITKKLESAQEKLIAHEKLAALGKLTSGIAHELKNPLNFINNFALITKDALLSFRGNSEDYEGEKTTILQNLDVIYEQGKKADSIVNKMSAHARTRSVEQLDFINVNQLLDDALNYSSEYLHNVSPGLAIPIQKNYETEIKPIKGVEIDLKAVFINIFNNAYDTLIEKVKENSDAYKPLIIIHTKVEGNNLKISIKDNGLGIEEKYKNSIFTPFFTTKPAGLGVGLSLSLGRTVIEEEHGGELNFISEEGKFTEFLITLPY